MMTYVYSFLFCGFICLLAQLILDHTKLTPGHVTSLFVVIGAFLDVFNIYDRIILMVGGGALVPITSFGHLLAHGALDHASQYGFIGLSTGILNLTSAGITAAIVASFLFSLIFKPRD